MTALRKAFSISSFKYLMHFRHFNTLKMSSGVQGIIPCMRTANETRLYNVGKSCHDANFVVIGSITDYPRGRQTWTTKMALWQLSVFRERLSHYDWTFNETDIDKRPKVSSFPWINPIKLVFLSGEPDYFGRNKISSGGDLSHYSSASLY